MNLNLYSQLVLCGRFILFIFWNSFLSEKKNNESSSTAFFLIQRQFVLNLYFDCFILAERNGNLSHHEMVTDMTLMRILKERPRLPENQIHRFDHARKWNYHYFLWIGVRKIVSHFCLQVVILKLLSNCFYKSCHYILFILVLGLPVLYNYSTTLNTPSMSQLMRHVLLTLDSILKDN